MRINSAVNDAINVYRQPSRLHGLWQHGLPDDVLLVIKIAAGDADTITSSAKSNNVEEVSLREAADFYLRQMFLHAGNSRHRLLGLELEAELGVVQIHRRWLLKWLHPDRAASKWKAAYFETISSASSSLIDELRGTVSANSFAVNQVPFAARKQFSAQRVSQLKTTNNSYFAERVSTWIGYRRLFIISGIGILILGALALAWHLLENYNEVDSPIRSLFVGGPQ